MRGADVGRGDHVPLRIEPEGGKVSEHGVEPQGNVSWDVLKEDEGGAALVDDPCERRP